MISVQLNQAQEPTLKKLIYDVNNGIECFSSVDITNALISTRCKHVKDEW